LWVKYSIDYEYGTAIMYCATRPEDPQELFQTLAYQCFGIRKSIGRVEIFGPNECEQPDEVKIYHSDMLMQMAGKSETVTTVPQEAKFVLTHSGGDTIIWSDEDTKLKSEWDD
jgi:hypothetical protein